MHLEYVLCVWHDESFMTICTRIYKVFDQDSHGQHVDYEHYLFLQAFFYDEYNVHILGCLM